MPLNCVIYLVISILAPLSHGGYANYPSMLQRLRTQDAQPIIVVLKSNSHISSEESDGVEAINHYAPDNTNNNFNLYPKQLQEVDMLEGSHSGQPMLPEYTQNVLRAALRSRCRRVNTCKRRCAQKARKQTFKCSLQCEATYDEEDLCQNQPKEDKCDACGSQWP